MLSKKQPPDWEDLMEVATKISQLSKASDLLDIKIKEEEAKVISECTTNPNYFVAGKAPSMEYLKATYKHTGLRGELVEMRNLYAEVQAELELAKLTFQSMRSLVDLYITDSANERHAFA